MDHDIVNRRLTMINKTISDVPACDSDTAVCCPPDGQTVELVLAPVEGPAADEELAATGAALESAKGVIRSEVAKQLGMRIVPTLTFIPDALPDSARALKEVLARAKAKDEEVAALRVETYAGEEDPYKKPRELHDDDEADDEGDPDEDELED